MGGNISRKGQMQFAMDKKGHAKKNKYTGFVADKCADDTCPSKEKIVSMED